MKKINFVIVGALAIGLSVLSSGCAKKEKMQHAVQQGTYVKFQYSLTVNEEVKIPENDPETISLKIGDGIYPAAFESAMVGLQEGDTKDIVLAPGEAFGAIKKELFSRVPRSSFPADMEMKVGMYVGGQKTDSGDQVAARIVNVSNDWVILDENHPLAGKDVVYKVNVLTVGAART